MGLGDWLIERLFADAIEQRVQLAVKVIDDDEYWRQISAGGDDRNYPWLTRRQELSEIYDLWREHFAVRRVVSLITDYTLGVEGVDVVSESKKVNSFIETFWNHPQNRMDERMRSWAGELSRSGEIFVVLSRNEGDGMTYVREIAPIVIDKVESHKDDLENITRVHQIVPDTQDGRWWTVHGAPNSNEKPQVIIPFQVNRVPGVARGESDVKAYMAPASDYQRWLEDRARVNRLKSAFVWDVTLDGATPALIAKKQADYGRPPAPGSIVIHNEKETWEAVQPAIGGDDAEADGKAMRLAIAAGAGVPLHFLGEGESATRATAQEMGDPTYRMLELRQDYLKRIAMDVCEAAFRRSGKRGPADLKLTAVAPKIARVDQETLGRAARMAVEALASMREQGWIDDQTAAGMALRSFGMVEGEKEIEDLLERAAKTAPAIPREERAQQAETWGKFWISVIARWQGEGNVIGKEWEAVIDADTCETCVFLHGQKVGLNRPFVVPVGNEWGLREIYAPPAHHGCRCRLNPVMAGEPLME